jgi:polyisoprenoid-binding protein YceI
MRTLLFLLPLLAALPARAAQENLLPATAQVQIRAFGLGIFPLEGNFARFRGWIRYDPGHPAACQVILQVDVTSLTMRSQMVRATILGPEFMNVSAYPDLTFSGVCDSGGIAGRLTLHGETHPLTLALDRRRDALVATGRFRRGDWGMTARSLTAGSIIRIRVEAPNPLPNSVPGPRG